jgi:hypothetical protein
LFDERAFLDAATNGDVETVRSLTMAAVDFAIR